MPLISGIDLDEEMRFSHYLLNAVLNTLDQKQIDELLLQDEVLQKMPRYFTQNNPKAASEIYLKCIKRRTSFNE